MIKSAIEWVPDYNALALYKTLCDIVNCDYDDDEVDIFIKKMNETSDYERGIWEKGDIIGERGEVILGMALDVGTSVVFCEIKSRNISLEYIRGILHVFQCRRVNI